MMGGVWPQSKWKTRQGAEAMMAKWQFLPMTVIFGKIGANTYSTQ
jgi:hypothetical protein